MNKVKYIRVSTTEQNTERQKINKKDFFKIYTDKISGVIAFHDRPGAKKLLADIESGQVQEIHVSSIDRLGRNILDILIVIDFFTKKNIPLFVENIGMYSMSQGKVSPAFNMIISVLGNVAEMERNLIKERQHQGIEIAKAKGVYKGRLYGTRMTDEELLSKYKTVVRELRDGESLRRAAKLGGCSLSTVQRIKKALNRD